MSVSRWFPLMVGMVAISTAASAQTKNPTDGREGYDQLLNRYLHDAREETESTSQADQSWGWLNGLAFDNRARRMNDLLTIQVVESVAASGTADAALGKQSAGSASVGSFFGLEKKIRPVTDPTALATARANTDFKGSGTTTRTGDLTANLTARVVEVLPSGDMVVEGVREIEINGDRQVLVLTGVVRPADINPANVVRSTSVGQLRIRYFGQGLMKDNLKPGWLIRVLNKVF